MSSGYRSYYSTPSKRPRYVNYKTRTAGKRRGNAKYSIAKLYRGPVTVNTGDQAFPLQFRTTIRYSELVAPTFTTGTFKYGWRANGIYDPNYTATGGQPLYFDQLMAIYNHYTVLRSKITFKIIDIAAWNMLVAGYIDDDTTWASTAEDAAERPGAVSKVYSGGVTLPTEFSLVWNANKFFGGSVLGNDNLQGTATTDPAELSYFVLVNSDYTAGRTGTACNVHVLIEYEAVFEELKTIVRS